MNVKKLLIIFLKMLNYILPIVLTLSFSKNFNIGHVFNLFNLYAIEIICLIMFQYMYINEDIYVYDPDITLIHSLLIQLLFINDLNLFDLVLIFILKFLLFERILLVNVFDFTFRYLTRTYDISEVIPIIFLKFYIR